MQAASWHRLYRLSGTCFSLRAASPWSPPKSRCAKKLYNIHDPILNCSEGATFLSPDSDMVREYFGAHIMGTVFGAVAAGARRRITPGAWFAPALRALPP